MPAPRRQTSSLPSQKSFSTYPASLVSRSTAEHRRQCCRVPRPGTRASRVAAGSAVSSLRTILHPPVPRARLLPLLGQRARCRSRRPSTSKPHFPHDLINPVGDVSGDHADTKSSQLSRCTIGLAELGQRPREDGDAVMFVEDLSTSVQAFMAGLVDAFEKNVPARLPPTDGTAGGP
jgi:hypothetical protein